MMSSFFCSTPCFSFLRWRLLWFQTNPNATLLSAAQHIQLSSVSRVPKCCCLCCSLWLFLIVFAPLAPCFHECAHQWEKTVSTYAIGLQGGERDWKLILSPMASGLINHIYIMKPLPAKNSGSFHVAEHVVIGGRSWLTQRG